MTSASTGFGDTSVNQSGKTGGEASGLAGAGSGAAGGGGAGSGSAWVQNVDPIGTGIGSGGDAASGAGVAQVGGDATDNTEIGTINIS